MAGILIVIATRTRINILHVIWLRSENKSEDCDQSIKPNKTFHFNQKCTSREALRVIFSNNYTFKIFQCAHRNTCQQNSRIKKLNYFMDSI